MTACFDKDKIITEDNILKLFNKIDIVNFDKIRTNSIL
jgi:hypothetical protein